MALIWSGPLLWDSIIRINLVELASFVKDITVKIMFNFLIEREHVVAHARCGRSSLHEPKL